MFLICVYPKPSLIAGSASSAGGPTATERLAAISRSPTINSSLHGELGVLIQTAYDEMRQAHTRHEPNETWRAIYTDASILRSLYDILGASEDTLEESLSLSCIAQLDRAIIIAGSCGEGRLELILEFIIQIQSHTRWEQNMDIPLPPSKFSMTPLPIPLSSPDTFRRTIRRIDPPPSFAAFINTLSKEPFILPGYGRDWPAIEKNLWQSPDHLRRVGGPGRVVPVEVGSDYRTEDWTQDLMGWYEFLQALYISQRDSDEESTATRKRVLYLAQHNLFTQFPTLRDDIILPSYVYAALNAPENYPAYRPPANDEQLVLNAWLGPAGTVSPAHTVRALHL